MSQPEVPTTMSVPDSSSKPILKRTLRPTQMQATSSGTMVQAFDAPFPIPSVFQFNVAPTLSPAITSTMPPWPPEPPDPSLAPMGVVNTSPTTDGTLSVVPTKPPDSALNEPMQQ